MLGQPWPLNYLTPRPPHKLRLKSHGQLLIKIPKPIYESLFYNLLFKRVSPNALVAKNLTSVAAASRDMFNPP